MHDAVGITIVILVIVSYSILLSILGVRYAFAIALLAGLARFVPYIGPLVTYIILGLVTLFQGGNYFNLVPIYYTLLTIILSILMDQIYDNLVSPRIMGRSLGVHPAAVLVVAIIAANLIGLIGLLLMELLTVVYLSADNWARPYSAGDWRIYPHS